jgi:hypothetical protein
MEYRGVAPVPQGRAAPGTYMTPGAFKAARGGLWTMIFGPILYNIARNWYQKTGNWQLALKRAIYLSSVWKAWSFGCLWWFVTYGILGQWAKMLDGERPIPAVDQMMQGSSVDPSGRSVMLAMMFLNFTLVPVALGAMYCQLVDRSLFRHRILYRIFRPVHAITRRIPWPMLLMVTLVPTLIYVQMRIVPGLSPTAF